MGAAREHRVRPVLSTMQSVVPRDAPASSLPPLSIAWVPRVESVAFRLLLKLWIRFFFLGF